MAFRPNVTTRVMPNAASTHPAAADATHDADYGATANRIPSTATATVTDASTTSTEPAADDATHNADYGITVSTDPAANQYPAIRPCRRGDKPSAPPSRRRATSNERAPSSTWNSP
mmetsp:Transcript_27042/g.32782  ORF Transcript_27042/g.32782 Transcript_27042/m.32782 type:complete len:116 (+) Transcript_27042:158-505(+)